MGRRVFSIVFDIFLLGVIVFSFTNRKSISYGLSQAKGQLAILYEAREVKDILDDPTVPDSVKYKLRLIDEVRIYAIANLGVKPNNSYTTFYDQGDRPLMWVVTATEPYRLQPYQWKFPVLGSFPYKGFFNKERALQEKHRLEKLGYDTDLGTASGWSTLGWFRDPVLSNMLKRSEGQLANLIIHELTHSTLYVKDSVDFNENLASFIGHQGAIRFLNYKYGPDSPQLKKYLEEYHDEKKFNEHILAGAHRLNKFYRKAGKDKAKLHQGKRKIMEEIAEAIQALPLKNNSLYSRFADEVMESGNAFFMSYVRYDMRIDDFEKDLNKNYNSDLRKYLETLKSRYPSL